jgi:hypothetical protein
LFNVVIHGGLSWCEQPLDTRAGIAFRGLIYLTLLHRFPRAIMKRSAVLRCSSDTSLPSSYGQKQLESGFEPRT